MSPMVLHNVRRHYYLKYDRKIHSFDKKHNFHFLKIKQSTFCIFQGLHLHNKNFDNSCSKMRVKHGNFQAMQSFYTTRRYMNASSESTIYMFQIVATNCKVPPNHHNHKKTLLQKPLAFEEFLKLAPLQEKN